jgi:transcriptional regulator with XRE-family HTH domain
MNIGSNLMVLRNKQNFSQQKVADYLCVDRKTYINWETGVTDIKSSYIPKLAEFLQVEINDLFREKVSNVVFSQNKHQTNNKISSINGMVLLLTDNESIEKILDVIKEKTAQIKTEFLL